MNLEGRKLGTQNSRQKTKQGKLWSDLLQVKNREGGGGGPLKALSFSARRTLIYASAVSNWYTIGIPKPVSTPLLPRRYPTALLKVPHQYPAGTPPLSRMYPTATSHLPYCYPADTPPKPCRYPTATSHVPHRYPAATPPLPRRYPTAP